MKECAIWFLLLMGFSSSAQEAAIQSTQATTAKQYHVKDYPDGFYYTIDDFINKTSKPYPLLQKRMLYREQRIPYDSDMDQLFFFTASDTLKLKNVFAVSFRGNLYIQQKYMHKYASKEDKREDGDNSNSYHRVLKEGRFLYFEGAFANAWTKGFASYAGMPQSSVNQTKGVVFDVEKREFNFLRNCEDFNGFLKRMGSEEKADCAEYSIFKAREIIDRIIR